jgi:hypothetical protein
MLSAFFLIKGEVMDRTVARIKSLVGNFAVTFSDPNGKAHIFQWSKDNDFTLDVPQEITYKDLLGRTRIAAENYPMDLLKAYGRPEYKRNGNGELLKDEKDQMIVSRPVILELVDVTAHPSITAPASAVAPAGSIEFAQ